MSDTISAYVKQSKLSSFVNANQDKPEDPSKMFANFSLYSNISFGLATEFTHFEPAVLHFTNGYNKLTMFANKLLHHKRSETGNNNANFRNTSESTTAVPIYKLVWVQCKGKYRARQRKGANFSTDFTAHMLTHLVSISTSSLLQWTTCSVSGINVTPLSTSCWKVELGGTDWKPWSESPTCGTVREFEVLWPDTYRPQIAQFINTSGGSRHPEHLVHPSDSDTDYHRAVCFTPRPWMIANQGTATSPRRIIKDQSVKLRTLVISFHSHILTKTSQPRGWTEQNIAPVYSSPLSNCLRILTSSVKILQPYKYTIKPTENPNYSFWVISNSVGQELFWCVPYHLLWRYLQPLG